METSAPPPSPLHIEDDLAVDLARRVENAVIAQTSSEPSGLDRDTERKAAAHICRAFPLCFGLKGAQPDSLNEVAFLIVRHLTQKAEQRRNATTKKAARVDFRMPNSRPRHNDYPYCHTPSPTATSPLFWGDLVGSTPLDPGMVRVENE
jgi:hypothetical protein